MWPVYCCTKGRAGAITDEVRSLAPTLVVEPQEAEAYRSRYPHLEVRELPENNAGIAAARNGAKRIAQSYGHPFWWLVDDDLFDFHAEGGGSAPSGRKIAPRAALFLAEQEAADLPKCALVGLSIGQARGKTQLNTGVFCCVGVHSALIPDVWWREDLPLKEDTELCLHVLSSGFNTIRVGHVGFRMPECGSKTGGLHEVYRGRGTEQRAARQVVAAYRRVASLHGSEVWVDWSRFPVRR